jgi:hypothetical protein
MLKQGELIVTPRLIEDTNIKLKQGELIVTPRLIEDTCSDLYHVYARIVKEGENIGCVYC